jgi:hypothetical protein
LRERVKKRITLIRETHRVITYKEDMDETSKKQKCVCVCERERETCIDEMRNQRERVCV